MIYNDDEFDDFTGSGDRDKRKMSVKMNMGAGRNSMVLIEVIGEFMIN